MQPQGKIGLTNGGFLTCEEDEANGKNHAQCTMMMFANCNIG